MTHINCPGCYKPVEEDRLVGTHAYCSCGLSWDMSGKKSKSTKEAQGSMLPLILFTTVLAVCTLHFLAWDVHSITILPLKLKHYIGAARADDYLRIADICKQRKKTACEIEALIGAYEKDHKNLTGLTAAAELYLTTLNYRAAAELYKIYYQNGGSDAHSRELYAKALVSIGDTAGARKQLELVLRADNKEPNFIAARAYVEILIQENNLSKAKDVIEEYRKASSTSALFLEKEWRWIHSQTKENLASQQRLPANKVVQ